MWTRLHGIEFFQDEEGKNPRVGEIFLIGKDNVTPVWVTL